MHFKDWFRALRSPRYRGTAAPGTPPEIVYVYLPASIEPIERGQRFEDPINDELRRLGIGEVSGGGSQLGERPDGSRTIEFCGIDVDPHSVDKVRETLR